MMNNEGQGKKGTGIVVDPRDGEEVLKEFHKLMLEALRQREQDIIKFLTVLAPALVGFVWLVNELDLSASTYINDKDQSTFFIGTIGVLLLLAVGAVYSVALGYNYRYITLQLAKLEDRWGVADAFLKKWPRCPETFLEKYGMYCTPPEIIGVFWWSYNLAIAGVTTSAMMLVHCHPYRLWLFIIGAIALAASLAAPLRYGYKMDDLSRVEVGKWKSKDCSKDSSSEVSQGSESTEGASDRSVSS